MKNKATPRDSSTIYERIRRSELPFDEERAQVNLILDELFTKHEKELDDALEESCTVGNPITYMQRYTGIDAIYYFGTKWGTITAYIADSPEDCYVKFEPNKFIELVEKPVETTKEQPNNYKLVKDVINEIHIPGDEYDIHHENTEDEYIEIYIDESHSVKLCNDGTFKLLGKILG